MPTPNDKQEIQAGDFSYVKDPLYRSVYANNAMFGSTVFDFAMTFAEILAVNPDEHKIVAEQKVRVVMSPLHFKLFSQVCAQNVKNFEESFGTIPIPPEVKPEPSAT